MGNKCCKCHSSTYSSANATIRSFSSYNSSIIRSGGSHAITFNTFNRDDSLTTLTMKSSNQSDVGRDYRGGSSSTIGQEDPIPIFLRRLNDLNIRVGTRTRFLIELDDHTGVQVRWFHNNLEAKSDRYQYIHEGGFFCLDIVPVSLEDEGLWVCTAQNYAGKSSTAAHLSLIVPKAFKKPIFMEQLKAVLTERGIVSLECKVIGVPTPKLRWYKDDKEIKAGDIFALTANSNQDCLGVYTCEATNVMGSALSTSKIQVAHLQIDGERNSDSLIPYGPPPKFVKGLKNVSGRVGDLLHLKCQVEVPPWPKSVGWYNDNGIVNEGSLYHLLADGLGMYGVEIKSLRADHSATWKCVATSSTGSNAFTSCLVSVSYPKNYRVPRFLESLRAIMTDEGLVSFECKVIGYPTPQLSWFKDGKQLQPGDVYELTGSKSLGSYCCVAQNCMGETSSFAELTMEDIQNQLNESEKLQLTSNTQPPRFLLGLKSTEANINESFVFTIKVTNEFTPSISWYKEDEQLSESNRYQFSSEEDGTFILNIIPLEIDDQAEWKCVAINKYGQTVTSSFLKLNIPKTFKPPRFLEELRIAFSSEGSVNLECKVIGVPQPQLKWFKDGQELNPGDMHKIISGQSGTCCLGTYTCQAHNCMGTVSSSARLLTMEDKSTIKSCASEYLSVGNTLVRNESLSTIPEERTSQMEKSYTIEEPADISFSFDGKEVTVSLYETPDLTHDEALQIMEMYADELSEHISEDNVVDLPSLRIIKQSSISGPVMMEALVIDVPIGFCQQQTVSDTEFDGVSLIEDLTLENNDKSDSMRENSLEYFSDHLSSSNSKKDIFFSASETTPKNLTKKPKSDDDDHNVSFQTPKLFMSDSDDQILTQLNMDEQRIPQTSRNMIGSLARTESNNTEEEVSETLADIENELPLSHNYCAAEILTQSDEDGLYSTVINKIRKKGEAFVPLSSEEDDVLKTICRPNVDEFLKYMKIILEGTMVKMHTHESFNFSGMPTELERSIQALHSLAWKFVEETEKNDVSELDKNTTTNVSSLMTAINASLLALEQIDDPFGVSDNILNEIQSSVCFDLETLNNKDLSASTILDLLSDQLKSFTEVVNKQVARVTEQRVIAVLRNTIGTTLVYIRQLQQNCSKIKCIDVNSLAPLFFMIQPLETILNDIAAIEEADESKSNLKLKQLLIPPISSIAFSLDNLNTAFKNENSDDDQDLKDIFDKINDSTIQFMALASQGTESNNLAECFICFTKPINDLCCHLRRIGRSTENIVSSDYGSDDKLLMDFETLFDELMMDIDTLINNVNVVRDSENNINPLSSLLEPLQDMKIGLFQVNQVLLSNQTGSNMSYEVISCFEHLSQQLVQLNNCIVNQSIVEETNKEMPFESSIKMMQNILFDDAIDDLGVNGILFGSVMKPLLQLQSTIVSKMASVESDLSFSEHTDVTGGACDTKSLSLSSSNNAQTVFNKAENDNLKQNDDERAPLNKLAKESDTDSNLLNESTLKVTKDPRYENNTKNDLLLKRGFECDIGATFKDEEPNILTTEDDRENSGFEMLFDETDLETISDFAEDDHLGNIVESKISDKSFNVLVSEDNINSVSRENYDIIPKHAIESFDQSIHQDSISNSSTDLFDELKETLKQLSEGTQDEVLDDLILKTKYLKECSPEHLNELSDKINDSLVDSFDDMKKLTSQQPEDVIKHLETSEDICGGKIHQYDETICTIDQVKMSDKKEMSQNEVLEIVCDEIDTTECVDSNKSISNYTVITNSAISDQVEIKTNNVNSENNLKVDISILEPLNVLEEENILKQEDNNESSINCATINDMTVLNNNVLYSIDMTKNNSPSEVCSKGYKLLETKNLEGEGVGKLNVDDELIKTENQDSEILHDDTKLIDNTVKFSLTENHLQKSYLQGQVIIEEIDPIRITETQTMFQQLQTSNEYQENTEINEQSLLNEECYDGELNKAPVTFIANTIDTTKEKCEVTDEGFIIIEEIPNETKQCILNAVESGNNDLQNRNIINAVNEIVEQTKELTMLEDINLITIPEDRIIMIEEQNRLNKKNIIPAKKNNEICKAVEMNEKVMVDILSKDNINKTSIVSNKIIDLQCHLFDSCENTVHSKTESQVSQTEDNNSIISNNTLDDKQKVKDYSSKYVVENLDTMQQSSIHDLNEVCSTNNELKTVEDLFEPCIQNSAKIVECDTINTEILESIQNSNDETLINLKRKECSLEDLKTIEDNLIITHTDDNGNDKISNKIINLEVLNKQLEKEDGDFNQNISRINTTDNLKNAEDNENKVEIPNENVIKNLDENIEAELTNKSESSHQDVELGIVSDSSVNREETHVNDKNTKNTSRTENEEKCIIKLNKSIEYLNQATILENNTTNDEVCDIIPQNTIINVVNVPLTIAEEKNALINNETITTESTQLIDTCKLDEIEVEIKNEIDNKIEATCEQKSILDNKDYLNNITSKQELIFSSVGIINDSEQAFEDVKSKEKELTSTVLLIEPKASLVCEEVISVESVQLLETTDLNLKNVDEKDKKDFQSILESQQITILENVIDTQEIIKKQDITTIFEENLNNELLSLETLDINDPTDDKKVTKECSNILNEKIENQNLKLIHENSELVSHEIINNSEILKAANDINYPKVDENVLSKSEQSIESEIEVSLTEDDIDKTITELETTKTNTEKELDVGTTCSSEINYLPIENDLFIKEIDCVLKDTSKQNCLLLIEENMALMNTEVVTAESAEVKNQPSVSLENSIESYKNQLKQVAECQNVLLLENVNKLKTDSLVENTTSIMTNFNETNIIEDNYKSIEMNGKFNKIKNKPIKLQCQVSIEECKAHVDEVVIVTDSTQSLKLFDMEFKNVNEKVTEHLVDSVDITELDILKSSIENKVNVETLDCNKIDTGKNKEKCIESKGNETEVDIFENKISQSTVKNDKNTKAQENNNAEKFFNVEKDSSKTAEVKSITYSYDTENKITENKNASSLTKDNIISRNDDIFKIETENVSDKLWKSTDNILSDIPIKSKQTVEENFNFVNETENRVINMVDINEEKINSKIENSKDILIDTHGLEMSNETKSDVSALEKRANWKNDVIPEGEITDLSLKETLNTSAVKPKLHCVEHLVAYQTKCVMLENVNTLKQAEKNITENARVEHELSIAAIGNLVIDYDSIKEIESIRDNQKHNLKNATLAYIDDHSNEIEVKHVNVFKAPIEEKTKNNENISNNALENSLLEIENKNSKCTIDLNEQTRVPDKLSKLEAQAENKSTDELSSNEKLNNETNIQETLKTKHEKLNELLVHSEILTETVQEKNKELILNEIQNDTLCENIKITKNRVVNDSQENDCLNNKLSQESKNSLSPDVSENISFVENKTVENEVELKKQKFLTTSCEIESIDIQLNIEPVNKGTLSKKHTEDMANELHLTLNKVDNVAESSEKTIDKEQILDEVKTNLCEKDKGNKIEKAVKNTDEKIDIKKNLSLKSKKSSTLDKAKNNNKTKINNEKMELENLNKLCNNNDKTKKDSNDKPSEKLNVGNDIQGISKNQEILDHLPLSVNESGQKKDILIDTFSEKIKVETFSQEDLILNGQHNVIDKLQQSVNPVNKIVEPSETSSVTSKTNRIDQTLNEFKNDILCKNIKSENNMNLGVNEKGTLKIINSIETTEITNETIEEKNKEPLDKKNYTEQLGINLKPEINEKTNSNTLGELENKNDNCVVEEITKNILSDDQIEKLRNDQLEENKIQVVKDEMGKDKKKRGSKIKKTEIEPKVKKSPSPEKLTQVTDNNQKYNQKINKTTVKTLEDKTVSNNKLSSQMNKELQEEIKDKQNIKQNATIIKIEEVEFMLNAHEKYAPVIDKIEILKNKDVSEIFDKKKSVEEENKKEQIGIKLESSSKDKSFSPEKSIQIYDKVNQNLKCNDELNRQVKILSQVEDILENNIIGDFESNRSKIQSEKKEKKLTEDQVQLKIVEENKQITNDREVKDVLGNISIDMNNSYDAITDELQRSSKKMYVPHEDGSKRKHLSTEEECDTTKHIMINRKNNEKVYGNEKSTLVSTAYEVTLYDDIIEPKKRDRTSDREMLSVNYVKNKSPEHNWTSEKENNSLQSHKFETNHRTLLSANLGEQTKYGYDTRKSPSKRYLDVTDAYQSQSKPLTYRSLTPESRLSSESLRYSSDRDTGRFYGNREVCRYNSSRSSSPCLELSKRSIDSYFTRSRSPAFMPYRCPSETAIKYYRLEDDLNMLYSRRRRGSDSFLHDSAARDSTYYSSWRLSERSTPSRTYTEDMNRTKETFRRLYFCVRLIDQTVLSGTRVKFWCSIIGYPEPRVQWYRDGQKLNSYTYNSSMRYQIKYTNGLAQLIVDNAQSCDSGEYSCVAANSQDRVSTTGFLTVYTSPSVFGTRPLQSSLSVDSIKSSRLDKHYLWSVNDLRQNIKFANYDWRSSDDTSRYSKYPKFLTSIIADDIATYGGTIALQVRVQGSPLPNVTWMRESKPLPRLSSKYVYLDEGELYTLLVKNSTMRDGGRYVCRACNLYGTADVEKTIKVVSSLDFSEHKGMKPAIIVSRPNDRLNVVVGEDITVTLRVTGEPKPKVIWMRGSRDITFFDRSQKETINDYVMLSIKKAQLSDAGTYFIIAKNVYGSDRAFVTVGVRKRARSLTPPRIRNTIVPRWPTARVSVTNNEVPGPVRSEPTVSDRANNRITLTWEKPEKAETILVYRVETRSAEEECWTQIGMTPTNCLDVYNLKSGYRYKFRVTARNRFGWGQPVVTADYVDVSEPKYLPEFLQPLPGETKVLLHHGAILQCHVRGVPKPLVTWFKDGEPLEPGRYGTEYTERGKCTLKLANAVDADGGRYACEAVNDQGRVCTFTVVQVVTNRRIVEAERRLQGCLMKNNDFKESAPVFTKRLIDRRVEINSTVRLSCQVNGLPIPSVLWYKDGQPVDLSDNQKLGPDSDNFSTLELSGVKYDDSGTYTAVATNSIGTASTLCVLEVINKIRTDPAIPEFIFGLPSVHEATGSIILNAQIDGYRPVKIEWFRNGIRLRNGRRVDIITDHDGNLELRIANATKRDSGAYVLIVSNDTGTVESRCDVNVVEINEHNDESGLEQISLSNHLYSKKPKFVIKPKFQEVEEGQEVVIDSEIVGDPLPKITWLRDGLKPEYYRDNSEFSSVANGNRYQLKIAHAKLTHTGTYTLQAANPHGQVKALISLQVYSTGHCKKKMENGTNRYSTVERLPKISQGLVDIECNDNDDVAFECKLNITQETDIRWHKDGKLVRLGKCIKSELVNGDTARLEISSVGPLHEGLYTCTAFNELGQDSTSARLILSNSQDAKSTPLNGQRKTMISSPILAGDSSNDRSSKRLKRSSAPKFYAILHDKMADIGETVRFQCSVFGHPPPWSSWEKDGEPIGINSRIKIREDDDHRSLEICDITPEDAGFYRVTVENKFGKIQATARLEVLTHHQNNDIQITSSTNGRRQSGSAVRAGEHFTLSCDIRGNTMSDVTWLKNDEEVKPNDRVTSNIDELAARLSISNLELADSGVYTCIARCESGVTRCSTELCVFDTKLAKDSYLKPPIFVEGLVPNRTVTEGEQVELTVRLQGAVPMSATWFKDDVIVPDCEDFVYVVGDYEKFSLLMTDPFSADSGTYSCKVTNMFGEAVSNGQLVIKEMVTDEPQHSPSINQKTNVVTEFNNNLTVRQKTESNFVPKNELTTTNTTTTTTTLPATILWGPCDKTVLQGAKVVLETSYAGNPEPRIQWLRAGKSLESNEHLRITNADGISSLTIDSITADDCGKYVVRVDNGLGNDYHFASVAVEGPPDAPAGRPIVSVSETSADVTWSSPAYDGGCMVTGYSVEVRPFNQSDWKLVADKCHSLSHIVRGLAPGESYVFRVRAENMHGSSEASLESIPVYILQTDYGNTLGPKKVNIENGELFTKRYEVLDELGKGRYGVVHKVKERESCKYYAAKFVRCIKSKDKEKAQEEVDIMNCLRHPKLLQLDAAFDNPRDVVMVTEYISGGELFERVVADDFTLTEKDCILFTRQICEGVDYMHKQNVVHLDLKPENIMCQSRTSHQIKLIDFGLAQIIQPGKPMRVLFGTPEFIPPEIISYEPIGLESDMWSVGVICYVLLSGLSPFMGDNDAETFTNITKAEFDFDDEAFDAISQDSKDFISALLIKRKEKRLTAKECLKHKWLAQQDMDMSCVILSTDKLKKFIIRRKWQKTGNAIRALGRMATMSAASRRGGGSPQQFKMACLSEEDSAGECSSSSPSPPRQAEGRRSSAGRGHKDVAADEPAALAASKGCGDGGRGRRSFDARSDSGFSDCSSLASSTAIASHVRPSDKHPSAIVEETPPAPAAPVPVGVAPRSVRDRSSPAHLRPPPLSTGGCAVTGCGRGPCETNRLIFDGGRTAANANASDAAAHKRKEPIRIHQTGDSFKKAVAFWKQ